MIPLTRFGGILALALAASMIIGATADCPSPAANYAWSCAEDTLETCNDAAHLPESTFPVDGPCRVSRFDYPATYCIDSVTGELSDRECCSEPEPKSDEYSVGVCEQKCKDTTTAAARYVDCDHVRASTCVSDPTEICTDWCTSRKRTIACFSQGQLAADQSVCDHMRVKYDEIVNSPGAIVSKCRQKLIKAPLSVGITEGRITLRHSTHGTVFDPKDYFFPNATYTFRFRFDVDPETIMPETDTDVSVHNWNASVVIFGPIAPRTRVYTSSMTGYVDRAFFIDIHGGDIRNHGKMYGISLDRFLPVSFVNRTVGVSVTVYGREVVDDDLLRTVITYTV